MDKYIIERFDVNDMKEEETLIVFSSEKGNTEFVAMQLAKVLSVPKKNVLNVSEQKELNLHAFRNIILGCSTWNADLLPYDFKKALNIIRESNLEGKNIAIFGTGNQYEYPHSFVSAIGLIYDELKDKTCWFVGQTNFRGYEFNFSRAKVGDCFVGLAIDEFGITGKIIAFFASLIAASLPVTGFYIWWKKRRKKQITL